MKITNDRLAVAWAVQEHIEFLMGESFDLYPEEVIAAIPEPPDDSPATLPAPTGIEQYARAIAEAVRDKMLVWAWTKHAKAVAAETDLDAIIASVPKPTNFLPIETELVGQPAPDVQAQEALLNPGPEVELARLRADYARRGVSLEHALKTIDEMQAQIDAARAEERDERSSTPSVASTALPSTAARYGTRCESLPPAAAREGREMRQGRKVFDADFGDVIEAHAEGFKDGRREGVIEGLGRALELALTPMPHDPALVKLIRTEIERLRAEQKVG